MNLLIFLDLTYNPCKKFKFYSLQGQMSKFFLFLPITRANFLDFTYYPGRAHVYLVSIGSCPPPPPRRGEHFSVPILNPFFCLSISNLFHLSIKGRRSTISKIAGDQNVALMLMQVLIRHISDMENEFVAWFHVFSLTML